MSRERSGLEVPQDLPPLVGGWELHEASYGGAELRLWVPRAPDTLLDDEAVSERNRFNDSMPYWAWLWESAPSLARLVAAAGWKPGTRVLEIGAGLGLVGLVAARLGSDVTLSDRDPLALATLRVNAREAASSAAAVLDLDWRDAAAVGAADFDVVLGCDVLYEAGAHAPVLDLIEQCLRARGEAWFADPGRKRLPAFLRRAEARGWSADLRDEAGRPALIEPNAFRVVRLVRGA